MGEFRPFKALAMFLLQMTLLCPLAFFMERMIASFMERMIASSFQARISIKPTKHSDEDGCTVCNGIDGAIFLNPAFLRAGGGSGGGLNGNRDFIQGLGYLARHVCAQLSLPPPCKALASVHTIKGKIVDCGLSWDHFFNITTNDGTNLITTRTPQYTNKIKATPEEGLQDALTASDFVWQLHIEKQEPMGLALSAHVELKKLIDAYKHCSYFQIRVPNWIESAAQGILMSIGAHGHDFDSLHIRRTDSILSCDSSVEAVVSLVDCAREVRSEKLLIFTDERDEWYHKMVVAALDTVGVSASVMDPIIDRQTANNYDTFQIGMSMQDSANIRFSIHRCKELKESMIRGPMISSQIRTCVQGWKRTYGGK